MKKAKTPRSIPFAVTRRHHLTETAEDYTELILDLIESKGEARICDLSKLLGVSHVTALRTVKRLERDGFVKTAPHQPIVLSRKGKATAISAKKRHEILFDFLVKIGVPKETAAIDVEGIEHHISEKTLEIIRNFSSTL